jgi:hypothetical protein
LLPAPDRPYAVPVYVEVKVHRDYRVQIDRALYSIPEHLLGQRLSARADEELVKLFYRGQLVKTHPRQPAGGRSTDPADLPAEKTAYAMRDVARLVATAAAHGTNVGIYASVCWITTCPGPKCARCIGCCLWSNATAPGRPTPRAGAH